MPVPRRLSLLLPALFISLALAACGGDPGRAAGIEDPGPSHQDPADGGPSVVTPGEDSGTCAAGKEGCPCETEGERFDCGYVYRRSGAYVSCSPGNATCTPDLVWGPCVGDQIAHVAAEQ